MVRTASCRLSTLHFFNSYIRELLLGVRITSPNFKGSLHCAIINCLSAQHDLQGNHVSVYIMLWLSKYPRALFLDFHISAKMFCLKDFLVLFIIVLHNYFVNIIESDLSPYSLYCIECFFPLSTPYLFFSACFSSFFHLFYC